jgi:hypothetical protein
VGVTGHRDLRDDPELLARIAAVMREAQALAGEASGRLTTIEVLSGLAEGADRLVACQVLREPNATLLAVLPLPAAEYSSDFASASSCRDFDALLARAREVLVMPPARAREEAYLASGAYIARHSDVLLALWDGLAARGIGGTAEIVDLARAEALPLLWIESAPPYAVHRERLRALRDQFRTSVP